MLSFRADAGEWPAGQNFNQGGGGVRKDAGMSDPKPLTSWDLLRRARALPLPPAVKAVLKELALHAWDGRTAWPSDDTLARYTGFSRRTVIAARQLLAAKGLIHPSRVPGRKSLTYTLTIPPPPENEERVASAETCATEAGSCEAAAQESVQELHAKNLYEDLKEAPPHARVCARPSPTLIFKGWKPNDADYEYAASLGLERPDDVGQAFVDYHSAKGTRSYDWGAEWRTWCRRELRFRPKTKPHKHYRNGFLQFIADGGIDRLWPEEGTAQSGTEPLPLLSGPEERAKEAPNAVAGYPEEWERAHATA